MPAKWSYAESETRVLHYGVQITILGLFSNSKKPSVSRKVDVQRIHILFSFKCKNLINKSILNAMQTENIKK